MRSKNGNIVAVTIKLCTCQSSPLVESDNTSCSSCIPINHVDYSGNNKIYFRSSKYYLILSRGGHNPKGSLHFAKLAGRECPPTKLPIKKNFECTGNKESNESNPSPSLFCGGLGSKFLLLTIFIGYE